MEKNNKSESLIQKFISYYKPYKGEFFLDMFCAFIVAAVGLIFPYATRSAIENLLPQGAYKEFFLFVGAMVLLYVLKMVMYYIMMYLGHMTGVKMEADMRTEVFSHFQKMSFSFFDQNRTGQLMSRVTTDLNDITEMAHHGPEDIFISIVSIVGSIILLFNIQPKLTIVLLIMIPLILLYTITRRSSMTNASLGVKRTMADLNTELESSISGVRETQSFSNSDFEIDKFDESNDIFRSSKKYFYKSMAIFHTGMDFLLNILYVVAIGYGGFLIMRGELEVLDLMTFTLLINSLLTPIRNLSGFSELLLNGMAGFKRMQEILSIEPEIRDSPNAREIADLSGDIEFDDVTFSYNDDKDTVILDKVSFKIGEGQKIAFVGSSGGGKTTICQLIPRFYEVDSGSIKIDGTDIREYKIDSLREHIGIVRQDVLIFAGTILDNILYGDVNATREQAVEAAKKAEIHDFILTLPNGYDTNVGERGVMLSGGQKQRVAIARVFLKNPKILILDEATSALDTYTERKIQDSLDRLSLGRTTLIIAHRLSTIENSDMIYVVGDGGILEFGTHDHLIQKNGEYSDLHGLQNF